MALLCYASEFDRPHALHPGTIQGKEGIKFCHLATLGRLLPTSSLSQKVSPSSKVGWSLHHITSITWAMGCGIGRVKSDAAACGSLSLRCGSGGLAIKVEKDGKEGGPLAKLVTKGGRAPRKPRPRPFSCGQKAKALGTNRAWVSGVKVKHYLKLFSGITRASWNNY